MSFFKNMNAEIPSFYLWDPSMPLERHNIGVEKLFHIKNTDKIYKLIKIEDSIHCNDIRNEYSECSYCPFKNIYDPDTKEILNSCCTCPITCKCGYICEEV